MPDIFDKSELTDLEVLLKHAQRGCWVFALYDKRSTLSKVSEQLRKDLKDFLFVGFQFRKDVVNPLGYLKVMKNKRENTIVFFYGIEDAGDQALKFLEYQREEFASTSHRLIFWISPSYRPNIAKSAPNFWSQRSGVFNFSDIAKITVSVGGDVSGNLIIGSENAINVRGVTESAINIAGRDIIHAPSSSRDDSLGVIPPVHASSYINRGEVENELFQRLRRKNSRNIINLTGIGGVGKTELAKKVVNEVKDEFESILWVDIGDKEPKQILTEILMNIGVFLSPTNDYGLMVQQAKSYFSTHKSLVILDDLRSASLHALGDFIPPSPPCSVLITSRIQQIGGVNEIIFLDRLTEEQSKALLATILGKKIISDEYTAAAKLAERCAFNPLALEIAARRIRQMQGTNSTVVF